ncbi:hypothetical protein V12B01_13285 [Vibrio splendidus 12B01]|nr:hypothetical protein V12B01_13285 [Vibrio splendidus 12B01]
MPRAPIRMIVFMLFSDLYVFRFDRRTLIK